MGRKHCGRKEKLLVMSNIFSSHSVFKRLVLQPFKNTVWLGKSKPITTQCHTLALLRYIAVENIVRKGEIACNKQLLLFSQCFLSNMALIFHCKCTLKCCLQFVSILTCLKFCLIMGYKIMVLIFHFKCTLKIHLQFVSIWTSLKLCRLVMG